MSEPLSSAPPEPVLECVERAEQGPTSDLSPGLNSAQRVARRRAQLELSRARPNQYVVYFDVWTGDSLERRVLVAADDLAECHRLMDGLTAEIRARATITRTPAPDAFLVPTSAVG